MSPQKREHRILFAGFAPAAQDRIREVLEKRHPNYKPAFLSLTETGGSVVRSDDVQLLFISSATDKSNALGLLRMVKTADIPVSTALFLAPGDEATARAALEHGADECVAEQDDFYSSIPDVLDRLLARLQYRDSIAAVRETIAQSRLEWITIIDAITDLIFIADDECRLFKMNQAFASLFNAHPKALIGKSCTELFGKENPCTGGLTDGPRQGEHRTAENLIKGELYQVSTFPLHTEPKQLTVHVMKNITETKKLKDLLYYSDKLASLGLLVGGVAHEINNPLTGIIGYAELLRMRPQSQAIDTELKKILEGAERCRKIVENLLTFSRQKAPTKSVASINNLIDRTIDLRIYWIRTNNIEIVKEYGEPSTVFADAQQLQLVLLNILLNAEQAITEAGKGNGRIVFQTKFDPDTRQMIIRISDNGPGIPQDKIPKIFDPFFTTKPLGTGTGLGLAISHSIITEHGGRMWVESVEGEGATLAIALPTSADAAFTAQSNINPGGSEKEGNKPC